MRVLVALPFAVVVALIRPPLCIDVVVPGMMVIQSATTAVVCPRMLVMWVVVPRLAMV